MMGFNIHKRKPLETNTISEVLASTFSRKLERIVPLLARIREAKEERLHKEYIERVRASIERMDDSIYSKEQMLEMYCSLRIFRGPEARSMVKEAISKLANSDDLSVATRVNEYAKQLLENPPPQYPYRHQ